MDVNATRQRFLLAIEQGKSISEATEIVNKLPVPTRTITQLEPPHPQPKKPSFEPVEVSDGPTGSPDNTAKAAPKTRAKSTKTTGAAE